MSHLIYLASDQPLPVYRNPHCKALSVNEALAMGMEVPDYCLESGFDRDKPDVLLWSDRDIIFDTDTHTIDDGRYDDDFSIFSIPPTMDDIYTEKAYLAELDCMQYLNGRSLRIIDYIREQLTKTREVELWNIWMGCGQRPHIRRYPISIDELTPEDLQEFVELDNRSAPDVCGNPYVHHCLIITR